MIITFVTTGTLEIDKEWGTPQQIQKDLEHDVGYALRDRVEAQWPGSKMSATTQTKVVTID